MVRRMSKEYLEALGRIIEGAVYDNIYTKQDLEQDADIVRQALLELKAIKEVNPSEALNKLDYIKRDIKFAYDADYINFDHADDIKYIKQSLLKAQEQDFNYKNIVIPFFDELVKLLGINDTDEMLDKIKEQEKVLEIIKEKRVDMQLLRDCESRSEYNMAFPYREIYHLTQEEFDLVRRYAK
jgi:hypothetical protein